VLGFSFLSLSLKSGNFYIIKQLRGGAQGQVLPFALRAQNKTLAPVMMIPSENTAIVRLGWTSGKYPTNHNFAEILNAINGQ